MKSDGNSAGGKRPGAGRPKAAHRCVKKTFSLHPKYWEMLDRVSEMYSTTVTGAVRMLIGLFSAENIKDSDKCENCANWKRLSSFPNNGTCALCPDVPTSFPFDHVCDDHERSHAEWCGYMDIQVNEDGSRSNACTCK